MQSASDKFHSSLCYQRNNLYSLLTNINSVTDIVPISFGTIFFVSCLFPTSTAQSKKTVC